MTDEKETRRLAAEALNYALATAPPNLDNDAWIDHLLEKPGQVYWEAGHEEGHEEGYEEGYEAARRMAQAGELP